MHSIARHRAWAFGLALNPVMLQRPLPLLGIGGVVVRARPSSSFSLSLQVLEGPLA